MKVRTPSKSLPGLVFLVYFRSFTFVANFYIHFCVILAGVWLPFSAVTINTPCLGLRVQRVDLHAMRVHLYNIRILFWCEHVLDGGKIN